jgi:hypothetical protein
MTKQKLSSLAYAFHRYGPVARTCLDVAGDKEAMDTLDSSIEQIISGLPANKNWASADVLPATVIHKIFYIQPNPIRTIARAVPASRYVARLLWERALKTDICKAKEVFLALMKFPFLRAGAGRMVEPVILTKLQQIGGIFNIAPMSTIDNPQSTCTIEPLSREINNRVVSFDSDQALKELIPQYPCKLIVPQNPNYPSMDAIMFTDQDHRVWLFQITLISEHSLSTAGLERLKKVIPDEYKPTAERKWIYIIVALDQKIAPVRITGKPIALEEKWEKLVEKYVLRIEEKGLFNINPSG